MSRDPAGRGTHAGQDSEAGHGSHDGHGSEPPEPTAEGAPEIPLDVEGRKWRADSSTLAGVRKMQSRVDSFAQGSDVAGLQRALQEDFNLLLRQCTMQGEAHDRLHQYLLPLRDRIDALEEGTRDSAVPELKQYLAKYWDYFSA